MLYLLLDSSCWVWRAEGQHLVWDRTWDEMQMKCSGHERPTRKRINKCQPVGIRASTTSYQLTFIVNDVVVSWPASHLLRASRHASICNSFTRSPSVINWLCSPTDGRLRSITLCTLLQLYIAIDQMNNWTALGKNWTWNKYEADAIDLAAWNAEWRAMDSRNNSTDGPRFVRRSSYWRRWPKSTTKKLTSIATWAAGPTQPETSDQWNFHLANLKLV